MISWEKISQGYERTFGEAPQVMARAPGRVNLIGEHIDYIGGHVLPIAINKGVGVGIGRARDSHNQVISEQYKEKKDGEDSASVRRFVRVLQERLSAPAIRLFVDSDLSIGAGLSSSAAFSVAVSSAMLALREKPSLSPLQLAQICMEAEHIALGTKCGLMDQYTAVFAKKEHAILIDCSKKSHRLVPCRLGSASLVVIDSGVPRNLAESGYNQRRREITEALNEVSKLVGEFSSIWEVKEKAILAIPRLSTTLAKRLRHALTEDERVLGFEKALRKGDLAEMGELLLQSHKSLRDDYEVSTKEIDLIVGELGDMDGVYGARIVGGGFGGSVLALMERDKIKDAIHSLSGKYLGQFKLPIRAEVLESCNGAELSLNGQQISLVQLLS